MQTAPLTAVTHNTSVWCRETDTRHAACIGSEVISKRCGGAGCLFLDLLTKWKLFLKWTIVVSLAPLWLNCTWKCTARCRDAGLIKIFVSLLICCSRIEDYAGWVRERLTYTKVRKYISAPTDTSMKHTLICTLTRDKCRCFQTRYDDSLNYLMSLKMMCIHQISTQLNLH